MLHGTSPSLTSPFPHQTLGKGKLSLSVTSAASDAVKWFVLARRPSAPVSPFHLNRWREPFVRKSSEGFLGRYKALAVSFDKEAQSVDSSDMTA